MFEDSLIDLEAKTKPRSRRWLSMPIALALHLVAVGSFTLASYWNVAEVAEPSLNVVFFSTPPPPMIKLGGGRPQPRPDRAPRPEPAPRKPEQPVQPAPDAVPDQIPAPAAPPATDDPSPSDAAADLVGPGGPGHPDGHPDGSEDGVPDGQPDGAGDPGGHGPAEDAPSDLPVPLSAGMTRPETLREVKPQYTEAARKARVQGTVIVEAVIDEQGNVTNVRVIRGLPLGLDKAAVDAIRQWRFKPAYRGGKPIKVYFNLIVNFGLER